MTQYLVIHTGKEAYQVAAQHVAVTLSERLQTVNRAVCTFAGAVGVGLLLLAKLAFNWGDFGSCLLAVPVSLVITGLTFLVIKAKRFMMPGEFP